MVDKEEGKEEVKTLLEVLKDASDRLNQIAVLDSIDEKQNISPDVVLAHAYDKLQDVVIMGYDKDGEWYFATSVADGGTVLWLVEHFKTRLMKIPHCNNCPCGEEEE